VKSNMSIVRPIYTDMTQPMSKARFTIAIPEEMLDEAKQLNINISRAARDGIKAAIEREKKIKELGL